MGRLFTSESVTEGHPDKIAVDTFRTGVVSEEKIIEIIDKVFDLRPAAIIDALQLRRPIYKQTAAYGHFGRTDVDLPWEHLDRMEKIKQQYQLLKIGNKEK